MLSQEIAAKSFRRNIGYPYLMMAISFCLAAATTPSMSAAADAASTNANSTKPSKRAVAVASIKEGPALAAQLTVGPFDIHRRYRSMEGPWVDAFVRIGDLIASDNACMSEQSVHYVENGNQAPSMTTGAVAYSSSPQGMPDTSKQMRELYWLKGVKIDVIDENGKIAPTAEFICHTNIDINVDERNRAFPDGERCAGERLFTGTQGQTEIMFPEGYAVPVASDETWRISFQAANRTTDEHRRIQHRATFYFIKDSDLVYPVTALSFRVPYVSVVVDRNSDAAAKEEHVKHPTCDAPTFGVNAPNSFTGAVFPDSEGRVRSGHWVVPPGKHTYAVALDDSELTDRKLRYGWVHIHPCCTDVRIVQCGSSNLKSRTVCKSEVQSKIYPGLEIMHIDAIAPKRDVILHSDQHYELAATYDNKTAQALDSMVTVGLFFEDNKFKRPDWSLPNAQTAFCGVAAQSTASGR